MKTTAPDRIPRPLSWHDWGLTERIDGGGGGKRASQIISETKRSSETGKAPFESSRRDALNSRLMFWSRGQESGQCQAK